MSDKFTAYCPMKKKKIMGQVWYCWKILLQLWKNNVKQTVDKLSSKLENGDLAYQHKVYEGPIKQRENNYMIFIQRDTLKLFTNGKFTRYLR